MRSGCPRRQRRRRYRMAGHERVDGTPTLLDCMPGYSVTVTRIAPWVQCAARLRELGILEGSPVLILRVGDPLMLLVKDTRIAVDLDTAAGIEVVGNAVPC